MLRSGPERSLRRPSIALVLAVCFGTLSCLAVLVVYVPTLIAARQNTNELFTWMTGLALERLEVLIEGEFRPIEDTLRFVAARLETTPEILDDRAALLALMDHAIGGVPQAVGMSLVRRDETILTAVRSEKAPQSRFWQTYPPEARATLEAMWSEDTATHWGPPTYLEILGEPVLNARVPVVIDGKVSAWLVSSVRVSTVSKFLFETQRRDDVDAFVLYGRDKIIAHPMLIGGYPRLSAENPVPGVDSFVDPVMASIWAPGWPDRSARDTVGIGHFGSVGNNDYIYVYKEIAGFSDQPWLIGLYAPRAVVSGPINRLHRISILGAAVALLAIIAAIIMGRMLSRPIAQLAKASAEVGHLEFTHVDAMPEGRFEETASAARAFNTMVQGLRWFESYVPRQLVARLTALENQGEIRSESQIVTIMFTDIRGFTGISENLSAEKTAAFLNAHFEMLTRCIEAEGGTVDKFIGDAVMAFWNAPEPQPDHAARACRAACAIRAAIAEENAQHLQRGEDPTGVRIGIHTGTAIVGNIGAISRINYTLVGDSVNVASRIEALIKELVDHEEDAPILISETVESEIRGDAFTVSRAGEKTLRGRDQPISVYWLRCD